MLEFLILLFLSTTFAYLAKAKMKYGLEIAFLLITIFAAIRYNYGNDYLNYLNEFEFHNIHSDKESVVGLRTEFGWFYLIFLFKDLGFYWLVAILTIIEQSVMYYFIKRYVDKDVYWIAVFVYLITTSLFLSGLSMMRQTLSISLCLIGFELSIRRKFIFSLAMVLLASQFHSSALLILPVVLFLYFFYNRINISRSISFAFLVVIIGASFLSDFISPSLIQSITWIGDTDKYSEYLSVGRNAVFGVSTVVTYFLIYMVLSNYKYQNVNVKYLMILFLVGCFIESFASSVYLLDRVALYFTYLMPVCYSMTFKTIKNFSWYPVFIVFFIVLKLYNYNSFVSTGWGQTFRIYHTIFE